MFAKLYQKSSRFIRSLNFYVSLKTYLYSALIFFQRVRQKKHIKTIQVLILLAIPLSIATILVKTNKDEAHAETNPAEWNMPGANPQRTSWVTESVDVTGIDWYRPIEAYIDQQVQVITGNKHAYISTSKGLVVLDAETGSLAWRFDTEMPLGNAPTVVGDMVYVGGFDHNIYAIQDLGTSYSLAWTFSDATLGYSANPIVVNGVVYVGNRDGYFYAIDADTGTLVWQYPEAGDPSLGPIDMSAAYSATTGDLYFAAQDMYGYALNASNGSLVWKTASKLPGERYQAWWPVLYQDKILFSGAFAYKKSTNPGTTSVSGAPDSAQTLQSNDFFNNVLTGTGYMGTLITSTGSQGWPSGTSLMDTQTPYNVAYDSLNSYSSTNFQRRTIAVINRADGTETVTAPFMFEGTGSGNRYPPIVDPDDSIAYIQNYHSQTQGNIGRKIVTGWKLGNQYLKLVGNTSAWDEPAALSGMGTASVMFNLVTDRDAQVIGSHIYWSYPGTLDAVLPATDGAANEYDPMWRFYTTADDLERLKGYYKGNTSSINGVYNSHGYQNPLVPYAFTNSSSQRVERIFTIRSNTIIAIGDAGTETALPLVTINNNPDYLGTSMSESQMQTMLENELDKIIDVYESDNINGFLKPGYYNHGTLGGIGGFPNFYFETPGDTLLALASAYPHVGTAMQTRLRSYMDAFYQKYFATSLVRKIGWSSGYNRDSIEYPSEITSAMGSLNNSTSGAYAQRSFYALWKYAQIVNNQATALSIYNATKVALAYPSNLEAGGANTHVRTPYTYNDYIAGYIGYLNLQELAFNGSYDSTTQTQRTGMQADLAALESYRATNFTKDHPIGATGDNPSGITINQYYRNFNFSRNFLYMTPELGTYLATNAGAAVNAAIDEYTYLGPFWFVEANSNTFQEGVMANLYDVPAIFSAKAYIEGADQGQLSKYIDASAFQRGGIFLIQNLSAALSASASSSPVVSTPVFSPASESFTDTESVTISDSTSGSTIYYTVDGSNPTQASTQYTGAINLTATTTVKARAYAAGYDPSPIATAVYTLTIPAPILTPSSGTYSGSVQVDVNPVNVNVTMYYTTNGTDPTQASTEFTQGVITFTQSTTFKVRSYYNGSSSSVSTGTYTVNAVTSNSPPDPDSQYISTTTNTPINVLLSYSDSDGPGPYTVTISQNPTHGSLGNMSDSDAKTWTYTPTSSYTGSDSFQFTVSDGEDVSTAGTINVAINASQSGNIVINHTMVDNEWSNLVADSSIINTIKTKRFSFKHASVGSNIWDALKCMGENYTSRPNYCDVNEVGFTGDYYHNPTFSVDLNGDADIYNDMQFYFHNETPVNQNPGNPNPPWYDKAQLFIDGVNSRESTNPSDFYSFKMGYVDGYAGNNVASEFFNANSSYTNISDIAALEASHPSKTIIYWTMGLARTVGTTEATSFNTQMRNYAAANNKILVDVADIESYEPDNAHCLNADGSGNEVICDRYTSETNGGHLNGEAKSRMAKAVWLMLACASGWGNCGGSVSSNHAPQVFAGVDTSLDLALSSQINLDGAAVDDGLPVSPGSLTYTWSKQSGAGTVTFGDDSITDTTANFSAAGIYVLRLTVGDGDTTTYDQMTVTVTESNNSPTASFTATPTSGTEPLSVSFDASASTDSDGTISTYAWDFGDSNTGSGQTASHTYTVAGSYTATLTVTDNDGATDSDTDSITVTSNAQAPVISNVTHPSTGDKFEKYELTFDIASNVSGLNVFLPYISTADASTILGVDKYEEKGITVEGKFQYKGTDGLLTGQPIYTVPGFYFEGQTYTSSKNVAGEDWLYPSGTNNWKVRYSPDQAGVWSVYLTATDANGTSTSSSYNFTVADNSNKGFIKVSTDDSKYFEYENGDHFSGLGYGIDIADAEGITKSETIAQTMSNNGMDLARFWLSGWSMFGGAWAPPYNELAYENNYLPYQTYTGSQAAPGSELSIRMAYYPSGNPGNSPMCLVYGWQSPNIAVQPSKTYKITLKYMSSGITTSGTGGLVVKRASWIDMNRNTCTNPANGTAITGYATGTSSGWQTITGEITTGASQNYLTNIYVTLDNVTAGTAYIDSLKIEELTGPSGTVVREVNPDYSADQHVYYNQRNAYAFDKMLENFENSGVALKLVLLEKMDKIERQFQPDGTWGTSPDANNLYGNTSSPRSDTKVRWLQRAWWRYVQARWGYSPAIHSYELLNEGDPAQATHFALADELGKYMKCSVFGQPIGSGNAQNCSYDHPDHHLVTTSTWYGFPSFWTSANYPNLDYADIHQYVPRDFTSYVDNFIYNKVPYYIQNVQPAFATIDLGNSTIRNYTKPIIRGETGFTTQNTDPYNTQMNSDSNGVWLHDFLWGQLNSGAINEQYWYSSQQITAQNLNEVFLPFRKFLDEENLNSGGYSEINFANASVNTTGQSNPHPRYNQNPSTITNINDMDDIVITGLKNTTSGRAVVWLKNIHNNWCVIAGLNSSGSGSRCENEPNFGSNGYNFNVVLSGFSPNTQYTLEKWDTWNAWASARSQQILDSDAVTSDSSGNITISQTGLTTDVAYKILEVGANVSPVALFTSTPTSGDAPLNVNFDASSSYDSDGTISTYAWDFGDSTTGSGVTASHTYSSAGSYTVTLTITDDGNATDTSTDTITVTTANVNPTASFTAAPTSGTIPLEVNFDATASIDSDGTISTYAWDFGDSTTGSGSAPSHTYSVQGTYTVVLTVTDNDGGTDTDTTNISANSSPTNNNPNASFTATPSSGTVPLNVSFNATASSDSDGTIVTYDWNFDDTTTASGPSPSHSFSAPGTYSVVLTVTDDDGATDTDTKDIIVSAANIAPTASFSATPTSGKAPLIVSFNSGASSDSDGTVSTYAWSFGDSTTGSGVTPFHTFTTAGNYTVTLTVTDDDGATDTETAGIAVSLPNVAPTASFTATPSSGTVPLSVDFDGTASSDSDGTISTYAWNFGDSTTGSGSTASHTYSAVGSYNARLTVTDNDGATHYVQTTITVNSVPGNASPAASFTVSASSGTVPLTVNFNGSGSSDSDGTISTYAWNFGDGNTDTSGSSVSHTYTVAGTYTASLTVTDDDGATNSMTTSIAANAVNSGGNTGSSDRPVFKNDKDRGNDSNDNAPTPTTNKPANPVTTFINNAVDTITGKTEEETIKPTVEQPQKTQTPVEMKILFKLSNGEVLANSKITVDGKTFVTDSDGYISGSFIPGKYDIIIDTNNGQHFETSAVLGASSSYIISIATEPTKPVETSHGLFSNKIFQVALGTVFTALVVTIFRKIISVAGRPRA